MTYEVALEVFQGPFDLLLQLIAKRKLEITEVDLADITADFLASLEGIEALDLETATRFLVVAATLIELKAIRLLPSEDQDELEDLVGEARDLLYARLLEYRAFREAAEILADLLEANAGYHRRDAPLPAELQRLVPDTELRIDAAGLAALAARALQPRPAPRVELAHIRRVYLSIRDAAGLLLERLSAVGSEGTFRELTQGRSRGDRVVVFLAMLELYKLGHVELEQDRPDAEIRLRRREGDRDLDALTDAEVPPVPAPTSPEADQ